MINLLSLRCGLAFAPYLIEGVEEFLGGGPVRPRSIRQGGSGLMIRSSGALSIWHRDREAVLDRAEAEHYLATIRFRAEFYDVLRMSDEIVLASTPGSLLLSHPQSELWLDRAATSRLIAIFGGDEDRGGLPSWLTASAGGGRLLLSDGLNGRWVMLGCDHVAELERRLARMAAEPSLANPEKPPSIQVKGVDVRLQFAFGLARALRDFSKGGPAETSVEQMPGWKLTLRPSPGGIRIGDSNSAAELTRKEAAKWAEFIEGELERFSARQIDRGRIRTVFADSGGGRWVLQWADEVFVPEGDSHERLVVKRDGGFLLLLSPSSGNCVALAGKEAELLAV